LFALGLSPAWVALAGAVALAAFTAVRRPRMLSGLKIPWVMALGVTALFVVVDVALRHGLQDWLATAAGHGDGAGALARVTAVGALGANAVNNLPAYVALESVTSDSAHRLMALLVGVNVGPLVTPWASLATLLWAQRCRAAGVRVRPVSLAVQGLACAAVAVGLALAGLVLLG
jgi:arsenical pump membrane protein